MVSIPPTVMDRTLFLASDTLKRESVSLRDYVARAPSRTAVLPFPSGGHFEPSADTTDGATTTAFTLSRLARARSLRYWSGASELGSEIFGDAALYDELCQTAVADFGRLYSGPGGGDTTKDAGDLPNGYSTPLHLSGFATACERIGLSPENKHRGDLVSAQLEERLRLEPFLTSESIMADEPAGGHRDAALWKLVDGQPNWYLTYLAVDAIVAWRELVKKSRTDEDSQFDKSAVASVQAASLLAMCHMLAVRQAGASGSFDALEFACCFATLARCISLTAHRDEHARAILKSGLNEIVSSFLHRDGTFVPKSVPLVDRDRTPLEVSSNEIGEIVLNAISTWAELADLEALSPVVELTCRRSLGRRGWGAEANGSSTRRSAFVAASSLALLESYVAIVESIRLRSANERLQVVNPPDMSAFDYPDSVADRIMRKTIVPIRGGRRDVASMSMILHGPPGTAKTTIARRIAFDLKWPILELAPSRLLESGFSGIGAEATRLFSELPSLRDVVVLFDEFEGFISRRDGSVTDESRFLTTSMLPHLHKLRDLGRIVFIIATNDLDRIDSAASRPGRIDDVIDVQPPSPDETRRIIASMAKRTNPLNDDKEAWESLWESIVRPGGISNQDLNGVTPGYVRSWINAVAVEFKNGYTNSNAKLALTDMRDRLARESQQKQAR